MNICKKKYGVILSFISQLIHIICALLYTPIMLRLLGQSEYGLYQLVFSVVSYLSILSFGFAASYLRFYSRYKVKKEEHQIAILNGMYLTIFLIIMGICILCGVVMVKRIEWIFSDGLSTEEYATARILMIIMVINLALTFPNAVFDSIISANEQFVFQKTVIVLQNLLNPFLALPLLIMGYGSVGMVCVTTTLTVARLGINVFYCLRKLHARFVFHSFDFLLLKEMWIFTFFIFLNSIIDQINWNVDKFLLGRILGTVAVAVYGVGGQINSLYISLSTSVSNVFVPMVNRIVAETNDNEQLTKLFTKVGRVQFVILSLILYVFTFLGKEFVTLWAGEEYLSSFYIALFLIVPVTIPLIQNIGIEIQRAKNMHKVRSVVYLVIAIANVFVSIPLIKYCGAVGATIGTAISIFFGNGLFMNWYYHKKIGINVIYFWKEIAKFFPSIVISIGLGCILSRYIKINGFVEFVIFALVYSLIYCIPMWFLGLNNEEKKMIYKRAH